MLSTRNMDSVNNRAGPSPSSACPTNSDGPPPPGFFARQGKHYRSTALTLYVFTVSQSGIYDSGAVTRSSADGHVPVLSSDGDRKELGKMVLSNEYLKWTLDSTPPQFGVQMKMDILPHYEEGVFQFVHIVLSTILEDDFTKHGAVAPTIKLTIYTPSDYYLWLNNLPFLRMLLNCAVTVTSSALRERYRIALLIEAKAHPKSRDFQLRSYKPLEEEARRLAGRVQSFLGAKNLLPSLCAKPRRPLPAPQLFRSEYGSTTAEALAACLKSLGTQPAFLSAVIAGCISCSNWADYVGGSGGRDGVGRVNYSHYYLNELPLTRVSRSAKVVEDAWAEDDEYLVEDHYGGSDDDSYLNSGSETPPYGPGHGTALFPEGGGAPSGGNGGIGGGGVNPVASTVGQSRKTFSHVPGGSWQASRIVILGQEWQVLPILMVCIFFYKRGKLLSGADPSRFAHLFGDAAEGLLPSYIAGQTDELSTGYAIQWRDSDSGGGATLTSDDYAALFDATNDEGTVLVIDAGHSKVTRYELDKSFHEPGEAIGSSGNRTATFGGFNLDRVSALELHGDETILNWIDEANALSGACAIDYYLQEQLSLTYQRSLLYEQFVRSGMLDPYDFSIGFVSVRPPPKPAKGAKGGGGNTNSSYMHGGNALPMSMGHTSQRNHGNSVGGALTAGALSSRNQVLNFTRPDYGSDDDTRSEGGTSTASSYGGGRRLGRKASTMVGDDDKMSSTSSIAPSPLTNMPDVQTRVWMADVRSRATEEERFVMDHRIRMEGMLGAEYTPSHGQLLHLLRFQQPK